MVRTRSNVLTCSLKGLKTWSGPVLVSSYVRAPLVYFVGAQRKKMFPVGVVGKPFEVVACP